MEFYLNNPNLKAIGVQHEWTEEQISEYVKCANDCKYFIKNYVKIVTLDDGFKLFDMYDFQEDMVDVIVDKRFSIMKLPRQVGKTTTVAATILWHVLFNEFYNVSILANKQDKAIDILTDIKKAYETLPLWMQQGVSVWNKKSIVLENGSAITASSTSASSARGSSCVTGDTKITVCDDNNNIFYVKIDDLINKSKFVQVQKEGKCVFCVYKITNKLNKKIYVGFHKTENLDDGYMGSGKLIKKAIEKYGIENFKKEILGVFNNQKEAEDYEALIVDKDFTLREDTYNISVGGNVKIMHEKNNPFYDKTHSEESRKKISIKNKGKKSKHGCKIKIRDEVLDNLAQASDFLGLSKREVMFSCGDPLSQCLFLDEKRQKAAEKAFFRREEQRKKSTNERKQYTSERFLGVPKSQEHREKIRNSLIGKKRENPQNKDPEKIRKTAEKHRGMKRSIEARKRMSEAAQGRTPNNKGKKMYHNPKTQQRGYFDEQPDGWIRGAPQK